MLVRSRFTNFAAVGLYVAIQGFFVLFLLVNLGVTEEWANLIQAFTSIETNFFLNHFFTWSEKVEGTRQTKLLHLAKRWVRFHLSRIFVTIPLNQLFFVIMVNNLAVNYLVAFVINLVIFTVINYMISHWFVFRSTNGSAKEETET